MGGQPKSEASSLSSAEVRRLWEEPAEETGPTSGSVGILALQGEEDVKSSHTHRRRGRRSIVRALPAESVGVDNLLDFVSAEFSLLTGGLLH